MVQAHGRTGSTVDAAEVERFSALSAEWWDPRGKMAVLHKFNPVRLGFIKEAACRRFERDGRRLDCLAGLRILDIGCGAGILSEPLARLGAALLGADPAAANIAAAKLHAAESGLARPPPRRWRMPASASTSCSPWRWSSTSPTCRCSCGAAPRWSSPAG